MNNFLICPCDACVTARRKPFREYVESVRRAKPTHEKRRAVLKD